MKKLYKDILRYIILSVMSSAVFYLNRDIIIYVFENKDITTQQASLLGAMSTNTLGTWGYVMKKFFETSAGGEL